MKGLLLKDWFVLWKQCKWMLFLVILYTLLPLVSDGAGTFLACFSVLFMAILPITVLGFDERSKWERYAAALPVSRDDLVLSKYLLALLGMIGAALLYLLSSLVLSAVRPGSVSPQETVSFLCLLFAGALAFDAVNFPIIFRLGVEKGRLWFFLIAALFGGAIGAATAVAGDAAVSLGQALLGVPVWAFPLAALAVFGLSAWLSCRLYARRDL